MTEFNNSTSIVIDLAKSSDARFFPETEVIHLREFENVKDRIKASVGCVRTVGEDRRHDTLTILGTRGSGKTSFLLSIEHYFKHSKDDEAQRVAVLKIIDPTLIEEKGHIFLNVVSLIKDAVDKKLDQAGSLRVQQVYSDSYDLSAGYHERQAWNKLVEDLAHGLPSMDGVGGSLTESDWQDPEYIMHKGMRAISAAARLEESFNLMIVKALELLNKDVFLLIFDDIDIDFRRGWPVLETIRKYFTSSRLITILSGELELFSLGIRKNKWENFGSALRKTEMILLHRIGHYNDLVTEMEGQYLQKLLKPELRIHLRVIQEMVTTLGRIIAVKPMGASKPKLIEQFYTEILKGFGIRSVYQGEAYRTYLMSLPLRSQIRFLSSFSESGEVLDQRNLLDAFASDLIEQGVDIDLLNGAPRFLNIQILSLLLAKNQLAKAYQLQPTLTNASMNGSLMALSLQFAQRIKQHPYLVFDYWIRVGFVKNMSEHFGPASVRTNRSSSIIEEMVDHARLKQDTVLRDSMGMMTAFLQRQAGEQSGPVSGDALVLEGMAKFAKSSSDEIANRIDSLTKDNLLASILAYVPLSLTRNAHTQRFLPIYSIYQLIGSVGELTRRSSDKEELKKALIDLSQVRTYPMPGALSSGGTLVEDAIDQPDEPQDEDSFAVPDLDEVAEALLQWMNASPGIVPPHLLGKISTRLSYALGSISAKESVSLGDAMHRRIVAFYNAILIEDVKENVTSFINININNTNASDKIFVDNLRTLKLSGCFDLKVNGPLTFSRWMLSCPLLEIYLNTEAEELWALLSEFVTSHLKDAGAIRTIYPMLAQVGLKNGGSAVNPQATVRNRMKRLPLAHREMATFLIEDKFPMELFKRKDFDKIVTLFRERYRASRSIASIQRFAGFLARNPI